jgi:hypothetical protein
LFDNCSGYAIDDCLQHDFEGVIYYFYFLFIIYFLLFFTGCRRVPSSIPGVYLCRYINYNENETARPLNKSEAMGDSVVGGTVLGTAGGATVTQVGMDREVGL